ncbi:MAG: oligosaccharide flippase family protein [Methanomassiliicoccales archaeon]
MIGRQSLLILAVRLLTSFLGFVGLFLITNLLGPEVYGSIAFTLSLLAAFNAVADLGFNSAHIKKVSEGQDLKDCLATFAMIKMFLIGLLVAVTILSVFAYFAIMGMVFSPESIELITLFTLYYVLYNLSSIVTTTYYGMLKIAKAQLMILADVGVRIPLIAIVAFAGGDTVSLAFAYVAAGISVVITAFLLLMRDGIRWGRPTLYKSYARFALPLALVVIVGTASANVDKILIGYFHSPVSVAFYSSSQSFLSVVALVGVSVSTITFPSFSKWHARGEVEAIRRVTLAAERYITMFGLPITALLFLFPTEIAVALFGPRFTEAGGPMRWLSLATFLNLANAVHASQINAVNRPDIDAKLTFLNFLIFVPLLLITVPNDLLGMPMLGLSYTGAAISLLISTSVVFMATRLVVLGLTGTSSNPCILYQLLAMFASSVLLILISNLMPITNWVILLLYVAMAMGSFSVVLYALGELRADDIRYILDMLNPHKLVRYSIDEVKARPKG